MPLPIVEREDIHDEVHFGVFSRNVPIFSLHRPLDPIAPPDVLIRRRLHTVHQIGLPDGGSIEVWGIDDPDRDPADWGVFPSPLIRLAEGDLFHCDTDHEEEDEEEEDELDHGHSIHWHGIEPVTSSDGVPKNSFGVKDPEEMHDQYIYQWVARDAGTYFYHCHRNTPLHFEMGMYGGLIIDPHAPPDSELTAPYAAGGPGYVRRRDELTRYDVERFWISDEMDPRWHTLHEDAGLGGFPFDDSDPGLNIFEPEHYFISGVAQPLTRANPTVVARLRVGQTLLLRILCAGYGYHAWRLGLDAEIVAMDGRTLGRRGGGGAYNPYSQPFLLPADTPFELTTARRFDALVRPTEPGVFAAGFTARSINNGRPEPTGRAETFIIVDPEEE